MTKNSPKLKVHRHCERLSCERCVCRSVYLSSSSSSKTFARFWEKLIQKRKYFQKSTLNVKIDLKMEGHDSLSQQWRNFGQIQLKSKVQVVHCNAWHRYSTTSVLFCFLSICKPWRWNRLSLWLKVHLRMATSRNLWRDPSGRWEWRHWALSQALPRPTPPHPAENLKSKFL